MNRREMASWLLLLLVAALWSSQTVLGFWFTENTFTYQPAQVVKDGDKIGASLGNASGSLEVLTKTEPWIRLGQSNEQQQQQCQCNLDWLQNQTSLWLGKWLDKAQVQVAASVAGARLSNSTGATSTSNINRREGNNNGARAGNHWGSWVSRSGGQSRGGNTGAKQQQQQHHHHHQLQAKLAQGPRGPPGPKGEQGPRGEQGPAGAQQLARVADRDALFDLVVNSSSSLVFVEAEQMLVVASQSGWRPVQLAQPLRDFRRTIAKFSLSAGDNLIGARRPGHMAAADEDDDERDEEEATDDELDLDEEEEDEDEDEEDEEEDVDGLEDNELRDKSSASALVAASMSGAGLPVLVRPLPSPPISPPAPVAAPLVAAAAPTEASTSQRRLKLRVAALNEPFSGNVHGIRGADFECKRQASKANIKGSFRALLSSSFQNLNEIVRHNVHKYPVVNLRDEVLANSWHELLRQPVRVANPLSRIYSFAGRHVATNSNWPNKLVWHGAGNRLGQRDLVHNCDGWHSDSLTKYGWATPLHAPRNLKRKGLKKKRFASINSTTSGDEILASSLLEVIDKYPCRMPLIVLCIETVGQVNAGNVARDAANQIN